MNPKNLLKIIEEVRKFDDQMEAQAIAVFFYVGTYGYNDGVLMQQIQKDLSLCFHLIIKFSNFFNDL